MIRKAVVLLLVCIVLSDACNGGRKHRGRKINVIVSPAPSGNTVPVAGGGGGSSAAVPPGGVLSGASSATPTGKR